MSITDKDSELGRRMQELAREVRNGVGGARKEFPSHPLWRRMRELGSELWLDACDTREISEVWTREFTGLNTNGAALSREVQKGACDELIAKTAGLASEFTLLTAQDRKLETAFVLSIHHALRLAEEFGARVSVEEHTDLSSDVEGAVNYARRFHAVGPGRFRVSIPFSAAGLLATRRISLDEIPVNQTPGFSARQNYLLCVIARPAFVNVLLGPLDRFVADNGLGSGEQVGRKAALASQAAVRKLRDSHDVPTRQVAAGLTGGRQVAELAGVDVISMTPRVAREFLELGLEPGDLHDTTAEDCEPGVNGADGIHLDRLWDIGEEVIGLVEELRRERLDMFTPVRLRGHCQRSGCGDLLVKWTDAQRQAISEEAEVPSLENWREELASGRVGVDSLLALAGWNGIRRRQEQLDQWVAEIAGKAAE